MKTYKSMSRGRLEEILNRMSGVRIGLIGDICLDVYWYADMCRSELSRETPHYPLPIVDERMSLGGGANVAANIAALKPKNVKVISTIGADWRGRELTKLMRNLEIDISSIFSDEDCITNTYIKPVRKGFSDVVYEDPRLDFTSYKPLSHRIEKLLIASLEAAVDSLDVLCVSDQMPFGILTERVREHICKLAGNGLCVVADSRYHIEQFTGCILKPNELEGAKAAGLDPASLHNVEDYARAGSVLAEKTNSSVFMTLGARGSLVVDAQQVWYIPAREIAGPVDFCGAGDSSLSGFALSLAAGAQPEESAYIAGLCSEVSIRQIGITGTASREQVLDWHAEAKVR